MRSRSRFGS
jgi:hypothetical protein